MTASNGFPSMTTAGQGLFNGASSTGLIQGQAFPDAAVRNALRSGIVSQNETVPMWGGIGVYADISPISSTGPKGQLGQVLGRATALTGSTALVGFTVFDQAYNMVTDPNNPVPTAGSGQSINYYPLGSRARIAVACDPALVSLRGGLINQQVSWDFVNQLLVPYEASAYTVSSGTYNSTTGAVVLTLSTTPAFSAGDSIIVSSATGTGSYASINGTWTVTAVSGNTVTYTIATGLTLTITGGSLTQGSGTASALPVTVLDVQPSGCMTVQTTGGLYTYNYSGACAIIQLTGGTTA